MFYSHASQPLEIILFTVLSTHFLLHQYFISNFPFFFYLLFTSSLLFLSCFCTVADIYNHSDLLSFSPKVLFYVSLLFCALFFFLSSGVFCVFAGAQNRSRGLVSWLSEAVCCRWSSALSLALVESHGAAFRHSRWSRGAHRRLWRETVVVLLAELSVDRIRGRRCCLILQSCVQKHSSVPQCYTLLT